MNRKILLKSYFVLGLLIVSTLLTACSTEEITPSETPTQTIVVTLSNPAVTLTATPFAPSATSIPLAARVNGQEISLEEYETELARFRATSGTGLATYGEEIVLKDLIDQVLLAQVALESGFEINDALYQTRIEALGLNDQELADWMATYGYTEAVFRQAMERSIAGAWMRDQIISAVPETAEQVHARQFLLYNQEEANDIYDQLETGADFETLIAEYEPLTLGDLGWFPRGYLTVPEIDDFVFDLAPGAYSSVIQTSLGYHVIQVIEHDPEHLLSPDAYRVVQLQLLEQWLADRRTQSDIELLLP